MIQIITKKNKEEEDREQRLLKILLQQQQQHATAMQKLIAAIPAANPALVVNVTTTASSPATQPMGLLQRQIKQFKRDILEWTQFWESFNVAIHSSTLTNVQKFDYLKEYLEGEAHLIVNNLELTDANYQVAIDELKKSYGKKPVMIDAHFNKLHTCNQ